MPDGQDNTDNLLNNIGEHTVPEHQRFEKEMAKLPGDLRKNFSDITTTRPVMRPSGMAKPKKAAINKEPGIIRFGEIKKGIAGVPGAKATETSAIVTEKYRQEKGIHVNPATIRNAYGPNPAPIKAS